MPGYRALTSTIRRKSKMAPVVRSHFTYRNVTSAPCLRTVSAAAKSSSSYFEEISLRSLLVEILHPSLRTEGVDPTGFEPASATWQGAMLPLHHGPRESVTRCSVEEQENWSRVAIRLSRNGTDARARRAALGWTAGGGCPHASLTSHHLQ